MHMGRCLFIDRRQIQGKHEITSTNELLSLLSDCMTKLQPCRAHRLMELARAAIYNNLASNELEKEMNS